jgi:hypothetical protein
LLTILAGLRRYTSKAKPCCGNQMKLDAALITEHTLLTGIGENDHHNRGISRTVLINSQAIAGLTAYELRIDLGATGFKTFRACLRGPDSVDIQGHAGVFVLAGDVSQDCMGIGIRPYGAGGYTTSYMGAYSRIHGDSYLTPSMFGSNIVLRDAYIDGDEAVLEFYNPSVISRNMTCYGTLAVK